MSARAGVARACSRRGARAAALAGATDRARCAGAPARRSPPSVAPGCAVARGDAPVHAAPPSALRRPRRAARPDERQPLRRADRVRRREARRRLGGIADAFLGHDRPIHRRCEDSVVRAAVPAPPLARLRARGRSASACRRARPVVAAGAELKSTFCVARGGEAFLSPHLGDLDSRAGATAPSAPTSSSTCAMLGVEPEVVAHDLHPEYLSTKWALEQDAELVGVQHHHAHAAACLAEHGETGPALALVFDGTGYGPDGTLWGGELLRCDLERLRARSPTSSRCRFRAARRRSASRGGSPPSTSSAPGCPCPWRALAASCARACSVERAALVGDGPPLRRGRGACSASASGSRYEGQAAIELELLAGDIAGRSRMPGASATTTGARRAVRTTSSPQGRPRAEIAAAFHETVAAGGRRRPACEAGEPRDGRALGRHASRTCGCCGSTRRAARGARASACSRTGSCRRTTAASATARPQSRRGGSARCA